MAPPSRPPDRTGPTANLPTLVVESRDAGASITDPLASVPGTDDLLAPVVRLGRFVDLGPLGEGAMGEVRRVLDQDLNRTMAMKILKAEHAARPGIRRRFIDEAQAAAQLQHPGIVPIHELGVLDDGRPWFTMREIRGRTLGDRIAAVHEAGGETEDGWTFRRLVDALRAACDAVACAHDRGVVHRDLKPDNVMIGPHGEVLVVDWGLAKVMGAPPGARDTPVTTTRSRTGQITRDGVVAGTPAYMPPEQARGLPLDARADVYALGAMLFTILHGVRPYAEITDDADAVIAAVRAGPPLVPPARTLPVPAELEAVRDLAMARDPSDRPQHAGLVARALVDWLDGVAHRERAVRFVTEAASRAPRAAEQRTRAASHRAAAARALADVAPWAPEALKVAAWGLQHAADQDDADADVHDVQGEQLLHQALAWWPDLPEALIGLADRALAALRDAEDRLDSREARRRLVQLEDLLSRIPTDVPAIQPHRAWLRASGTVSLDTTPAGVPVHVLRYVRGPGRLRLGRVGGARVSPVRETLPIGSYVAVIDGPSRVRVPFVVERGRETSATPHADGTHAALPLPRLSSDEVLVAAGPWTSGGDPHAIGSGPRARKWCESFVMARFPVTNAAYVAFLDDLVAQGREAEASRFAPRERGGTVGAVGAVIYGRSTDGRFVLRADADGDVWRPDWPVFMVDWHGATAFARWTAARTGLPWRLPTADEVEKAARGVDARIFPWGDRFDPSWCCMRDSHPGRPEPAPIDGFPHDESPWGVRGLAGNVRAWCRDGPSPGRRFDRGGFWLGSATECRAADLHDHEETHRAAEVGIRLVRDA